jgi:predicted DNA-binding protein with PD1-like motif
MFGSSHCSYAGAQFSQPGVVLAGSAGQGFTPHIITIAAGEDVASRIMSFVQHGPRAVCVMSATGAISNVTLRQQSSSGGTVTYEVLYMQEIHLLGNICENHFHLHKK